MQMPLGRGIHRVAEGAGLGIQIAEVGKRAAGQKIVFDEMKGALDPRGAVRIAFLVGAEDEAEALGEGRHLGGGDHPRAGAGGDHDVRVINHAGRGGPGHVLERVGQEDLAGKAIEGRRRLEEEQARVAQHQRGGLDSLLDAADRGTVGRRVVLHLLPRREVVVANRRRRGVPNPVATAKRRQRGVRDRQALLAQLLVDAHQIAAAAIDPRENLLTVRLGLLRPDHSRDHRAARREHRPDGTAGDLQGPGDLSDPVALGL